MCSPLGTRCNGASTCVTGNPITACIPGPHGCTNCLYALLAGSGEMVFDEATRQWIAPKDALHGNLVSGLGLVVVDPGATELQPDDIILTIASDDGRFEPVNISWASLHWEELQLPKDKQPKEYKITFYRPGKKVLYLLGTSRA